MPQFSQEQRQNAAVIIRVGAQVGASSRDILIALMTAMQESGLRNLNYGDRDSQGLFQQRPSMGWGSVQQITNPEYSARAFFLGAGTNKGLLSYNERNGWSLTKAAQTVQRSAFPDAYAKHEKAGRSLLEMLGDGKAVKGTLGAAPGFEVDQPTIGEALGETLGEANELQELEDMSSPVGEFTNPALDEASNPMLAERVNPGLEEQWSEPAQVQLPNVDQLLGSTGSTNTKVDVSLAGSRGQIVELARQFLGTPYVWGGANPSGFDCSGLLQYVYGKIGVDLPRVSADQARAGKRVGLDKLKPGDLVAWDNSSRNVGADHIAIYIGNGKIIHAPRPGASVEVSTIFDRGNAWGVAMNL